MRITGSRISLEWVASLAERYKLKSVLHSARNSEQTENSEDFL